MTVVPPAYYTLDTAAQTITFTAPYNSLSVPEFLSIINLSKQIGIYNSKDPRHHMPANTPGMDISITGGVLSYVETAGMENTDEIQIIIGWTIIDGGTP